MKTNKLIIVIAVIVLLSTVLVGVIGAASLPEESAATSALRQRDPAQETMRMLGTTGLLLVPDAFANRIMAFDPITGDLVDANFVPSDPVNLNSPNNVILSASGNSLLIADDINDLVLEYDLMGNFVGVFAPIGGPDEDIMDDPRGMALRSNGNLLVVIGEGVNADAVAEFDANGNFLGNFIEPGGGGLAGPFDIYQRSGDWLVSDPGSGKLKRFALESGNFIGDLASINAVPLQLAETLTDNILVSNFAGTQEGIVELASTGSVVNVVDPIAEYAGVYELENGNFLVTANESVFEISRAGVIVDTKIDNVAGRLIEFVSLAPDFSNSSKDAPATAETGSRFTYTIVIDNSSDTPALNASLDDPIPAGLTYVPGSVTGGAVFEAAANKIKWSGDVAPNSAVTITFEVDVTAESGWVTNTASIFHVSTGFVDVSASTNIVAVAEGEYQLYMPVVLKSE
jgi:uncharacterized repeat protein (TIGR01451 family)